MTEIGAGSESGKSTALVVDDDQRMGRSISRILSVQGNFDVTLVTEPGIALIQVLKNPFDIIVSDIVMRGLTGLELIKGIRAFNRDVPVILITGAPTIETAQEAVGLHAYRYLTKPVDSD